MAYRSRTARRLSRIGRTSKIAALEVQRRSLIAALVKIDAEIAALRNRPSRSANALEEADISTFGDDDDAEQALVFDELS